MFEIGIFCVILFAVVYWAILFIMGRRDDVLHGEFVKAEGEPTGAQVTVPAPVASPALVSAAKKKAKRKAAPPTRVAASLSSPPAKAPPPNTEALQSLLVSLKRELKNAAKI